MTATKSKTQKKASVQIGTTRTLVLDGEVDNLGTLRALVRAADDAGFTDAAEVGLEEWDYDRSSYVTKIRESV